jgi:hypothetical protein
MRQHCFLQRGGENRHLDFLLSAMIPKSPEKKWYWQIRPPDCPRRQKWSFRRFALTFPPVLEWELRNIVLPLLPVRAAKTYQGDYPTNG